MSTHVPHILDFIYCNAWSNLFLSYTVPSLGCSPSYVRYLSSLRLDELLELSASNVPFEKQVMLVLKQTQKSKSNSGIVDVGKIVEVFACCRNKNMSGYCVSRLDICLHLSASFAQFYFICRRIFEAQQSKKATITYIPSSCYKYISPDSRTIVMNWVETDPNPDLLAVRNEFETCVKNGLLSCLKCNEKSRSGKSSNKNSPVLHTGFSTSNCGDYSTHRSTQLGHITPSLIRSYLEDANDSCRQSLGKGIAMQNYLFRESPDCFGISEEMVEPSPANLEMQREYSNFFALDKLECHGDQFANLIRNKANTCLINNHIDCHYDSLNDPSDGNSSLISLSIMLPRSEFENTLSESARKWLDYYGYNHIIPFCNLNYSRIVCRDAAVRPDYTLRAFANQEEPINLLKKAISDALADTKSLTNYACTYEIGLGLGFDCISRAMHEYSRSQRQLHRKLGQGTYRDVYKDCVHSMGENIIHNIKSVYSAFHANNKMSMYDWTNDCTDIRYRRNSIPLALDPSKTFQGPKVTMVAAYDINRYHSSNVDAFRDLMTNLGGMGRKNRLAFACFASIQSNSTLPVAELLRILAMNKWSIKSDFYGKKYNGSFWDMAVNVATLHKFKSVGSSREQRFQISGQGKIFDFGRYCDGMLRKFSEFDLLADNDEALFPKFCETMNYMREEVGNVGHIIALKFVQLSSLIGLLPLRVSTFAEVRGGAPEKILAMVDGQPTQCFMELVNEFRELWGHRFTPAYLENLLCELYREMTNTVQCGKDDLVPNDVKCLHKVGGAFKKRASKKKDHFALYSHRGLKRCIPSLYRTVLDSSNRWKLEVQPLIFNAPFHDE